MKYYSLLFCFIILMSGIVYLEVMTWRECLADNSWFYCLRTINN
jgi:hypothetical protein